MIKITLPDGQVRELAGPQTIQAIATIIAPSLGKAALRGVFANKVCRLDYLITTDGTLEIITD